MDPWALPPPVPHLSKEQQDLLYKQDLAKKEEEKEVRQKLIKKEAQKRRKEAQKRSYEKRKMAMLVSGCPEARVNKSDGRR